MNRAESRWLCPRLLALALLFAQLALPFGARADEIGLHVVGQIGGASYAVAVQGNYAYLGVGPRLVVLDVSDPAQPRPVGQTAMMPETVQDVHMSGTLAYVADGEGGLRIVDVSDPTEPRELGGYNTDGLANGVAVVGPVAYVADGGGDLLILDVSDPEVPRKLGREDLGGGNGFAMGVVVAGRLAFVANDEGGLRVVDVSDPTQPPRWLVAAGPRLGGGAGGEQGLRCCRPGRSGHL